MIIGVIGLGLIGGSFALDVKRQEIVNEIIGVDKNETHQTQALELGLVDEIVSLNVLLEKANLIVIAIPVDSIPLLLNQILDRITESQMVIDLGSTKELICTKVFHHANRKRYVACHPIAGTEFTGPSAAFIGLYNGKVNIICDKEKTDSAVLRRILELFEHLGMTTIFMSSKEHDKHIAYVSHLSHISSFALGKTVLEIEESEKNIFNMAGSGFASTVRLAKSSPDMWTPIFDQNSENLSVALGAYIENLKQFKSFIDSHDKSKTHELMTKVNEIKRVLKGIELNN